MGRRSGFSGVLVAVVRETARQQRISHQNAIRAAKEAERYARAIERQRAVTARQLVANAKQAERDAKREYVEAREEEARQLEATNAAQSDELANVLPHTLSIDDAIDFDDLRVQEAPPRFDPGALLSSPAPRPSRESFFADIKKPNAVAQMLPWVRKRHEKQVLDTQARAAAALLSWSKSEEQRKVRLAEAEEQYKVELAAFFLKRDERNAEVDEFRDNYIAGDPHTLVSYFSMVLERSEYPEGFPQNFSVAYATDSKQIVVRYELPTVSIVPVAYDFRYVKARDAITNKTRKVSEIKQSYTDLIASISLRTIHELFESDTARHLEAVCINGFIQTIDPATGREIRPHLISVRATRQQFGEIDLARADKIACLRNLGAQVSRSPEEAQPVKPVVEFEMADARFIDQSDTISEIDARTNLMDLNPYQFEELVANLFSKLGLETKLTRASRDGGVDCVAFDPRPVLGGKVVIQAKRYKNTVGVSAVRDLYGTMMNEGANKGILVTTSGYGPDAFEFQKDKPIELIDGGGLLFLLQEIGLEARIIMPTD